MEYRIWHISWLCQALEKYRKSHSTIKGNMTIEEFINENLKDEVDGIIYGRK